MKKKKFVELLKLLPADCEILFTNAYDRKIHDIPAFISVNDGEGFIINGVDEIKKGSGLMKQEELIGMLQTLGDLKPIKQ